MQKSVEAFREHYGREPDGVAIAPGRINLIGEHTDYNEGFVFPAAIDKEVVAAYARTAEPTSRLYSIEVGEGQHFDATTTRPGDVKGWGAYAAGMAWVLREAGHGVAPNIVASVSSDLPIGAGISSSAALELAFGVLWNDLMGANIAAKKLALLAQRCENEYVGVRCGIMDQMASALGRSGHALFLDTRSLEIEYAPIPPPLSIVVCDTGVPRALAESAYNERRRQCEVAALQMGVPSLRDASLGDLESAVDRLEPVLFRRARHVITENARCQAFREALRAEDGARIATLMKESHASLRDDYEVSSKELDQMATVAQSAPGCVGARMTGAGFGGACVALVQAANLTDFVAFTQQQYQDSSGIEARLIACQTADGARVHSNPING